MALNVDNRFDPIHVETGRDFLSGSAFLANKSSPRREALVEQFPKDAVVLDMEAFAVLKKQFLLRQRGKGVPVFVIKGISDVGDERASVDKDRMQRLATRNALKVIQAYLMEVVEAAH